MPRDADFYMLSSEEMAEYYRSHRNRSLDCDDGKCGGCPWCLEAQGMIEDEDEENITTKGTP